VTYSYTRVKWVVDTRKLNLRLGKLAAGFKDAGELSLKTVGEMGKARARLLAPKYSGKTFQGISLFGPQGGEFKIVAKNPTASDGWSRGAGSAPYRTRGKFNLVKWMHESPSAAAHIKTGDHQFMYTTADYLRGLAPKVVRAEFNKIVAKN